LYYNGPAFFARLLIELGISILEDGEDTPSRFRFPSIDGDGREREVFSLMSGILRRSPGLRGRISQSSGET